MRLPMQAKPVVRSVNIAKIEAGVCQSDYCEKCLKLPNPARSICLDVNKCI